MSAGRRVRTGSLYTYQPVMWDRLDRPHGVKADILISGDTVRVVKLHGCPPPNTMGMCHIDTLAGEFAGLVCTNSLQPLKG